MRLSVWRPIFVVVSGIYPFTGVLAADTSVEAGKTQLAKRAARLWSLQAVVRPVVPPGSTSANPIDAFIQEVYREKGLRPAPTADKLTLLRRVTFDLIGLP